LVSLCFLMLCVTQVFAQNRTITGTVTAKEDGLPIPGATVKVKGTNVGAQTNTAGKFTLSVPSGATLVVSFVGTITQEIPVGSQNVINVALVANSTDLGEVVITTSLGIRHTEKELGYAAGRVTGKDLTETNVTNVANGLTAKIAGLGIYTLDNGVDPNVAIVLRGNRSLEGNNNALIVLDGVPIPGATIGSINPNDIADVTILKGAGSAALYGSEASNGAILITTKRGSSDGKPTITYGNSFQFEKVAFYPKLQTQFGIYGGEQGSSIDPITGAALYVPYENQQYGPAYDGSMVQLGAPLDSLNGTVIKVPYKAYPVSPIKAFFVTGYTEQNDVSFQQGDSKNSFFISAQNVRRSTVVPDDKNLKNAFSVRGHRTYGIFSADYSVGYTRNTVSTYGGSYVTNAGAADLYASILQLPAFLNIKAYQNPDTDVANPSNFYDAYAINPYWTIKHSRRNYTRDILLSQLKLKVEPTNWFSASYQLSNNIGIYQERDTNQEVDFTPYAVGDPLGAGNVPSGFTTGKSLGTVSDFYVFGDGSGSANGTNRIQGDALLDFHHTFFKDFKANLILGNSVQQQYAKYNFTGSNQLLLKDFYNINTIGGLVNAAEGEFMIRQIAYFGDASISYKGYLTLDATFRNEQDSRLSKAERSFNYPSVRLAFIPTDAIPALKDNKVLSYWKLYASMSRVGNIDIQPYQIYNIYGLTPGFPFGSLGGLNAGSQNYSPTLKPELTTEQEFGTELQFFNGRLDVNLTYYNQHVKNQTVAIGTSITTGYSSSLLNIGETQSQGKEIQVTGDILTQAQNKVGVRLGANLSINDSKVISLLPGVNSLQLPGANGMEYAVVGQPFPMLRGTDFVRDPAGHVVVSATTGYPSRNSSALATFGRTTPKYNLGLTGQVSYKFVSLSGVAEYRGGAVVMNGIGGTLTFAGSSYQSASAGRQPFVYPNSVIQTSPGVYVANTNVNVQNGNYGFWQSSAYSGTNSPFVTSADFWKLRELNLTFNLNQFIKQTKFMKGLSFALTGRNLFVWVPKNNQWGDPEFSNVGSTTNTRGVNGDGQLPGTRVFGADLKVTF
ncbi:MAG: SusC/RagA family TonB-linked outer membrane protein, partial [Mucilaginibacter sp.]